MPIGKDHWEAFLAAVARNTVRREHGEQPGAPSPTCEACQGTGWVTPWFDPWQVEDARSLRLYVAPANCFSGDSRRRVGRKKARRIASFDGVTVHPRNGLRTSAN